MLSELHIPIDQSRFDLKRQISYQLGEHHVFHIFNSIVDYEQSTTGLNGQFLHSQLLLDCLLKMKSNTTDKDELISLLKKEYKSNKLALTTLTEFQETYTSNKAVWWYTRSSCFFKTLNKALRLQNIDLLFAFAFFIRDIEQQLIQKKCDRPICLFRGQTMSNKEVQTLSASIGQLISLKSFLSASIDREIAELFIDRSHSAEDMQQVLFEIKADPQNADVKPFADIRKLSCILDEGEVLIMAGSIFRLDDIRRSDDGFWIIQMTLCNDYDHDLKTIYNYMKYENDNGEISLLSFAIILWKMGLFNDAEKYFNHLLQQLSDRHEDIAECCHYLGYIAYEKGDNELSIDWHRKSLDLKLRTLKSDNPRVAESYNCMGLAYWRKGDLTLARKSYRKALTIWRLTFDEDHREIARCFNNIGLVYRQEKRYEKALTCHRRAMKIRRKCLPIIHPYLGLSHNNIGSVYYSCGQYDHALKHYKQSLQIKYKSLPPSHPDTARTLSNLGYTYEKMHKLKQALFYFRKAATNFRFTFSDSHRYVQRAKKDIERLKTDGTC